MSGSNSTPFKPEKTFKSYTSAQGAAYAAGRFGYHNKLFGYILDKHTLTGGKLDTILDVGCGPGTAVRELAPHFTHAIGLDASDGMITTARDLGGTTSSSEPIRFEISSAEELGSKLLPAIPDSSIDMITAATAAHWFDMSRFWPRAAQVLKPGGSVVLWTGTAAYIHPSTPNCEAIRAAMEKIKLEHLDAYQEPGNEIARNLYIDLPLPWTLEASVDAFDQNAFIREVWNPETLGSSTGGGTARVVPLEDIEKRLATSSAVTRWRDDHPDAAGTERDIVRVIQRKVEELLHAAGVEKGKEEIIGGMETVILVIKKKT